MMSTPRLKCINRQEQQRRKFVCVMNEVAKTQQDLYKGYIDREMQETEQRCQKDILCTRRNVVRQRVLKKCMKNKREEVERKQATDLYGRYHGVSVERIAEGIDHFLEQNHPRIRRQKKIDDMFDKGYERGEILDGTAMRNKVQSYFDRPLVSVKTFTDSDVDMEDEEEPAKQTRANSKTGLTTSFYTGDFKRETTEEEYEKLFLDDRKESIGESVDSDKKLFVKRKVSRFLSEDTSDDMSIQSDVQNHVTFKPKDLRPITLPPIKVGTDNSTADGKPKSDCITELMQRMSHAKQRRERETKIKKEKRAKRLQAERVHRQALNDMATKFDQAFPSAAVPETATSGDTGWVDKGPHRGRRGKRGSGTAPVGNTEVASIKREEFRLPPIQFKTASLMRN